MPRWAPGCLLALMPGLYAWDLYSWKAGLVVYLAMLALLLGLQRLLPAGRWLLAARVALIVASLVAISLSTMTTCNRFTHSCHKVFIG